MEFQSYVSWISSPIQIAFLDLVLGADNAIIIALVCRSLPRHQRINVMVVGTGAAMLLRIVLTALTGAIMYLPVLRLAGGLVLILIAISLTDELDVGPVPEADEDANGAVVPRSAQADAEAFWDAILLVVLADGVMSLDNTVALAAVARGDVLYLVLGLALSVPTLVFGSWLLSELLGKTPFLGSLAMAVLGWVAGEMAVSDPLVADWIRFNAPALTFGVPIAAVIFVLAKVAFRPVLVPAGLGDPLVGYAFPETEPVPDAPILEPVVNLPIVDPTPIAAPDLAPTTPDPGLQRPLEPAAASAALGGEAGDNVAVDMASELAFAAPMVPQGRSGEERLVAIGLIALFGVAALIIGSAIYFGGATF